MSARRWVWAMGVVLALGAGATVTRWWAGQEVVRLLEARAVSWSDRVDAFESIRLTGIEAPGLTARAIQITLIPAPSVVVEDPIIDLRALRARTGPAEPIPQARRTSGLLPTVKVDNLRVQWGDDTVVSGWGGTLLPQVRLRGPGGSIERTITGTWSGTLQHDLHVGPLAGLATVSAQCTADCNIQIDMPAAVLEHPMLAAAPLPPTPLHASMAWQDGAVDGTVRLGDVEVDITGRIELEPARTADLTFQVPDTPLQVVVDLFGDLIPEARRTQVVGTIGAHGTWRWPDQDWTLTPRLEGLGAEGVLTDIDGLRNGTVFWTVPDASGVPRMKHTGATVPGFIPFQAAGLFPAAVLAAEDSGFSRHNGVDPVAIQAALDDARVSGLEGMRGGSTITQQLAKNLFLETRERTLVRKLRELLYALELDRVIPKQRILELYINVVELGDEIHGVGPASHAYFLKQPTRLTAREVAFLAALLPAPRSRGERAWRGGRPPLARMDVIIDNMRDMGRIDHYEAAEAKRTSLRLVPPPR